MKRGLYIVIMIIVVYGLSSPAIAGIKLPKSVCLSLDNSNGPLHNGTVALAFKNSGMKIKTMDGTQKLYDVKGAISNYAGAAEDAVTGTVFIDIVDNQADGIFMGNYPDNQTHCAILIYFSDGQISIACSVNGGQNYSYIPTEIDCKDIHMY